MANGKVPEGSNVEWCRMLLPGLNTLLGHAKLWCSPTSVAREKAMFILNEGGTRNPGEKKE